MAKKPRHSVRKRSRWISRFCGKPLLCLRVISGWTAMQRLHVMNEGMVRMGISMPLIMPKPESACAALRPARCNCAGMSADCAVRMSDDTRRIAVSGKARENISEKIARRLPAALVKKNALPAAKFLLWADWAIRITPNLPD